MTEDGSAGGGALWRATGGDFWRDLIPDIDARADRSRVDSSAVDDEVRELFLTQVGESIVKLRSAIAAADARTIRQVSHSFQGTGGAVGVPEISAFGEVLSSAARSEAWDLCSALTARLKQWHALNGGADIHDTP